MWEGHLPVAYSEYFLSTLSLILVLRHVQIIVGKPVASARNSFAVSSLP